MENTDTATKTMWKVDPTHSEVQFKVKHLVITTVTGYFKKFGGSVKSPGPREFDGAEVEFTVNTDSIDTNVNDRDNHLRSEEFFSSQKHPKMQFREGKMKKTGDDKFVINGKLTIREHTQLIELTAELGGIVKDGYGQTKAGFEINGKLKRKEYGLAWDQVTEAGSVVVGDEVRLQLNVQIILQEE